MKIQVSDLKPNPFRMMDRYPVDRSKVDILKQSIEQTEFWDNLLCRKNGSGYQIAYGHHRLIALQELGVDEVDIPVRDISDPDMLRIMANENREEYGAVPAVINETIRATRDWIRANPDLISPCGVHKEKVSDARRERSDWPGFETIADFLGWHSWRVRRALADINAIDKRGIAEEAINILPNQERSRTFRESMEKTAKKLDVDVLPEEKQVEIAQKVVDDDLTTGEIKHAVEHAYVEEMPPTNGNKELADQWITEDRIDRLIKDIKKITAELRDLRTTQYIHADQVGSLSVAIKTFVNVTQEIMNNE